VLVACAHRPSAREIDRFQGRAVYEPRARYEFPAVQRGSAVAVIRAATRQAGVPVWEACKETDLRAGPAQVNRAACPCGPAGPVQRRRLRRVMKVLSDYLPGSPIRRGLPRSRVCVTPGTGRPVRRPALPGIGGRAWLLSFWVLAGRGTLVAGTARRVVAGQAGWGYGSVQPVVAFQLHVVAGAAGAMRSVYPP
jgi:hypothetical protein